MNCSQPFELPGPIPFDIHMLQDIADNITKACTDAVDLAAPSILTVAATVRITGETSNGSWRLGNWSVYRSDLILQRLASFKVPLLQLIFQFPQPPYGIILGIFSIIHLTGDPIDSISSLLFTLYVARQRAKKFKTEMGVDRSTALMMGLITVSLDEIGEPEEAALLMDRWEYLGKSQVQRANGSKFLNRFHLVDGAS